MDVYARWTAEIMMWIMSVCSDLTERLRDFLLFLEQRHAPVPFTSPNIFASPSAPPLYLSHAPLGRHASQFENLWFRLITASGL